MSFQFEKKKKTCAWRFSFFLIFFSFLFTTFYCLGFQLSRWSSSSLKWSTFFCYVTGHWKPHFFSICTTSTKFLSLLPCENREWPRYQLYQFNWKAYMIIILVAIQSPTNIAQKTTVYRAHNWNNWYWCIIYWILFFFFFFAWFIKKLYLKCRKMCKKREKKCRNVN